MFDTLSQKLFGIFSHFSRTRTISEHAIAQALVRMHAELLAADVPDSVATSFIAEVKRDVIEKKVSSALDAGDFFVKIIYDRLVKFLSAPGTPLTALKTPARLLMMGLQGSGKTTSIIKIAHFLQNNNSQNNNLPQNSTKTGANRSCTVTSLDFTRAAAREQLKILAEHAKTAYYHSPAGTALEAAHESKNYFQAHAHDIIIFDTAGRMQVNNQLLEELKEITTVIQPNYRLLVLDAMTGQEALNVAQKFDQAVGFDGIMLTKMDGSARAGAALACAYTLKKPLVLVGTGERPTDYELFYPDRIAKRILGIGDLESLVERVNSQITHNDQEQLQKRFFSGNFTLDDFAQQLDMVQRLGSFASILRFLPGGLAGNISREQLDTGEKTLKRLRFMIDSMTKSERICPAILDKPRIARIAKGAGVSQAEVRDLLVKFEQSRQFAKLIKKNSPLLRK